MKIGGNIKEVQSCSHCGATRKGNVYRNEIWLCRKHYDQFRKFGKFLDNVKDSKGNRNEYVFNDNFCGIILKNKNFKIVGIALLTLMIIKYVKIINGILIPLVTQGQA